MAKLYFFMMLLLLTGGHLLCQYQPLNKKTLNTKVVHALGNPEELSRFYETLPVNDTVFRLEIHYDGFENYLFKCLEAPIFKYVQELSIYGCYQDIPAAISKLKNLTDLYINNHCDGWCESECSIYIPNEIYRLPNLEMLTIANRNVSISDSIVNLPKLKRLNIPSVSLYPFLFTDMPQLKSIWINDVTEKSNAFYKTILNKILVFSNSIGYYPIYDDYFLELDGLEKSLKPTFPLTAKEHIKILYQGYGNGVVFELIADLKNNKAIGEWTAKGDNYALRANYITGEKQQAKITLNDTIVITTITKSNNGAETHIERGTKTSSKNNVPFGTWEYGNYEGKCYYKINFDGDTYMNALGADTINLFTWKSYKNGVEHGVWREYNYYEKKIREFDNSLQKTFTVYNRRFTVPTVRKEFSYDNTNQLAITTHYRGKTSLAYKYSEEHYTAYIPDGKFATYFENGSAQSTKIFSNGKLIGNDIEYYENKQVKKIDSYDKGLLVHGMFFYTDGVKEYEFFKNAHGMHGNENHWTEKGKLRETTYYNNGLPFGISQTFNEKGEVMYERFYDNGVLVYDESRGFDNAFVFGPNKLLDLFSQFELPLNCCRYANCTTKKTMVDDSTFRITEHEYSTTPNRHLKYVKEFNFKNYKLDGTQMLKDSAGNIIQYVHYKDGLKEGTLTLVKYNDSLSLNFSGNRILDTVLKYSSKHGRQTETQYYKNMQLYETREVHYSINGKETSTLVVEYVKQPRAKPSHKHSAIDRPLSLIMGLPSKTNSMFFVPKKIIEYYRDTIAVTKFHARVTEANCMNIRKMKGYAIEKGRIYRFKEGDETKYEYWFRIHSVFNMFFNGMVTCY